MRSHLPLLAVGLLTAAVSAPAQSPAPGPTPAAATSPSPKRQRHKKADATASPTPAATGSAPVASPASGGATPIPAKKTKEERQAANKARLDQLAAATPKPGGGPGLVWVNIKSKAYHDQSSPYYGKTKEGKYVTEAAAKAEGDHPAGSFGKHATPKPQ